MASKANYTNASSGSSNYRSRNDSYSRIGVSYGTGGKPPVPKPYDFKAPPLYMEMPELSYRRPELSYRRPDLYLKKPELDLRTLCPLCKQPVAKAA
jgi:hypothetical protein